MARVIQEELGSFNPVLRDYFSCPVCESTKFVELVPYGGLWCDRCNAQIEIAHTCDGPNKVAVHVYTEHCHKGEWTANIIANSLHGGKPFDYAWTVIWESDKEIRWMKAKDGKMTAFWRIMVFPKVEYLYYGIFGYYNEDRNAIILPYYYANPFDRFILLIHEVIHWFAHFLPEAGQDFVDCLNDLVIAKL